MPADFVTLSAGAVTLGFLHCLVGPDHYVPFIAMSRIGSWSFRKTMIVTLLCGIGHILSSVVLGFLGHCPRTDRLPIGHRVQLGIG